MFTYYTKLSKEFRKNEKREMSISLLQKYDIKNISLIHRAFDLPLTLLSLHVPVKSRSINTIIVRIKNRSEQQRAIEIEANRSEQ